MSKKPAKVPVHRAPPPKQVRIIGGIWKRSVLPVLDALGLRPTPDRVRETVFNWINHLWDGDWSRASVLDLFAGSGALGFEALSRGAAQAIFVESDSTAAEVIARNAERLGASDRVQILRGSALALPRSQPFDLILADPPYGEGAGSAVVESVAMADWLAAGGWMSIETSRSDEVISGDLLVDSIRDAGRARITLLRRPSIPSPLS